jgi:hypothetical protein
MASARVLYPWPSRFQQCHTRPPHRKEPVHGRGMYSSGVTTPSSRAMAATAGFQVDAGA